MICPTCRGFGWIGRQNTGKPGMQAGPCPECGGDKPMAAKRKAGVGGMIKAIWQATLRPRPRFLCDGFSARPGRKRKTSPTARSVIKKGS